jgi:integrase
MTAAMTARWITLAVMARRDMDMTQIRQRGNSYQVNVYAGLDPLTGRRLYLSDSTTDLAEAKRIRNKFRAEVDEQRHARTKGTMRAALVEWLKTHEVEASTRKSYEDYLRLYVGPAFGDQPIGKIKARTLEQFYAELRRCSALCDGEPFIEHRDAGEHECRTVKHRRRPGRPPAGGYPPHDCAETGCVVTECQRHECRPLSSSTILKVHFVLSGVFDAAVRWEWITSNPAEVAKKPRQPTPQPKPPTTEQAAQIIDAAWAQDATWGTLVWLVMVTGLRRGEVLALRWSDFDLAAGKVDVRRALVRTDGQLVEKSTKTHQMWLLSLDPVTVDILREHRARYLETMSGLAAEPSSKAFLFSHEPSCDRPSDPDAVTHRYSDMCAELGIDSHLHALRHYSATSLLTAGVDLRTVAGRLGHGGGGATTLRVYAAWVGESDRRAAEILGDRLQRPPRPMT